MDRKKMVLGFLVIVCAAYGFMAMGCGQSTSGGSLQHGTYSYIGTQSPGDVWSWTVGEGTVMATNETLGFYYSGTFTALSSGFLKGFITASNDPNAPTDGSATFYMLELPNTVLLVKPGGSSDRLIVCAARAGAAPAAGQFNWIKIPGPGWDNGTAYGTAEVTVSGGSVDIEMRKYDLAGNLRETTIEAGYTFTNGRLSRAGSDLQVYMTPSGIFFGDNGPGSGGFAGVKHEAIDLSDATSKNYRGVRFSYNSQNRTGVTSALGISPHPTIAGAMRAWSYSNLDTNSIDPNSYAAITVEAQALNGMITETISPESGSDVRSFKLVAARIGGKYVFIGISARNNTQLDNFVAVEQ